MWKINGSLNFLKYYQVLQLKMPAISRGGIPVLAGAHLEQRDSLQTLPEVFQVQYQLHQHLLVQHQVEVVVGEETDKNIII